MGVIAPMMETFQDIADPTCVRLVNPADLAASFVTGVRLKSVTLEVTDEAVTEGRVQGGVGVDARRTGGTDHSQV